MEEEKLKNIEELLKVVADGISQLIKLEKLRMENDEEALDEIRDLDRLYFTSQARLIESLENKEGGNVINN